MYLHLCAELINDCVVTRYADVINDQWNYAGGKFTNGYPSITSHYGYHMVVHHVLLALNGQNADLSNPTSVSIRSQVDEGLVGHNGHVYV